MVPATLVGRDDDGPSTPSRFDEESRCHETLVICPNNIVAEPRESRSHALTALVLGFFSLFVPGLPPREIDFFG